MMTNEARARLAVVDQWAVTTPSDPYLSLRALAVYSDLSVKTLRRFLERTPPAQALPCYRLHGKVLVRKSEFDQYLAQFKAQGRPGLVRTLKKLGLDKLG